MADSQNVLGADPDAALVTRFKQGDEGAFDSLPHRHKDGIYSLVYRTVGDGEVEDVVQDVFVRMYKSLRRFRGESSFRTWLYRITVNACRDHVRALGRRPTISVEELPEIESLPGPADLASSSWTRSEVERAIHGLPQDERAAVEMHYVQGMSYREMAETLRCPVGTVKARVHSAITKLRRKLMPLIEEVSER